MFSKYVLQLNAHILYSYHIQILNTYNIRTLAIVAITTSALADKTNLLSLREFVVCTPAVS